MNMQRPRRLRKSKTIRNSLSETSLRIDSLVAPFFLKETGTAEEIRSMPGIYRYSLEELLRELEYYYKNGLRNWALFPVIPAAEKNSQASESFNEKGLVPRFLKEAKKKFPESNLITDIALDPYSSDGHDGLVENGKILNDETVQVLCKQAVAQAQAGADFVAPSDMMDGRVGAIRKALDGNGFQEVGILAYTAKYASAFYGPFRDALDSAPRFGDKKTYQMDPRNYREARRELQLDIDEGADIVMVKPAGAYLDVIRLFKEESSVPIAAYQVSGEYAQLVAAAERGWLDREAAIVESLVSIRRAGADLIFSYFAKEILQKKLLTT